LVGYNLQQTYEETIPQKKKKPIRKQMELSFWLDISCERSPAPRAGGRPLARGCSVGVHRREAASASAGLHQCEAKIDQSGIRLRVFEIGRMEIKKMFSTTLRTPKT
jgi:hypothetical protein